MLRTCVIGCALTAVLGLAVGCNFTKESEPKNKDEAVASYKLRLGEVEKNLNELKAKAEKAAGEDKAKLEVKWKEADAKRETAARKLQELEKAAADKWQTVSKEVGTALEDAAKAVKE